MKSLSLLLALSFLFINCNNLNNNYSMLTSPEYREIIHIEDEFFLAENILSKYGIINHKNEIIVDFIYDKLEMVTPDIYVAELNNQNGVIDKSGNILIPFNDSYMQIKGNLLKIISGQDIQYIDVSDMVFLNLDCDEIISEYNGMYVVKKNGETGVVDKDNNIIFPLSNRMITGVSENRLIINKKNDFNDAGILSPVNLYLGVVDFQNNIIADFDYVEINKCRDVYICSKYDSGKQKYGCIDDNGKIKIPFDYIYIKEVNGGFIASKSIASDFTFSDNTYYDNNFVQVGEKDIMNLYEVDGYACINKEDGDNVIYDGKITNFKNIEEILAISNDKIYCLIDGKKYIVTENQKNLFDTFEQVKFAGDYILIKTNGLWGIVSSRNTGDG